MRWAETNREVTRDVGEYFQSRLHDLAARYPALISSIDGWHHLSGIAFTDLPAATAFVASMAEHGLDLSAQTYKTDCPPVVLTKIPLIAGRECVDFVCHRMDAALADLNRGSRHVPGQERH
jgi:acetylornithine/succinyldiaminopimelate/putrescine aminotransferase